MKLLLLLTIASAFALNAYSQASTIQWQKNIGGSGNDYVNSTIQTSDGGYISIGRTLSQDGVFALNQGGFDAWITKLDPNGGIQWIKTLGGTKDDGFYSVLQTSDGGYIAAGLSKSNNGNVSGHHGTTSYSDFWIVKFDGSGNILWQKSLGGTGSDEAYLIKKTTDGGYIVTGNSYSNDGDVSGHHGTTWNDYWIVKLDINGNIQWQNSYGGTNDDRSNSIVQTSEGGYIITGSSFSNDGDVSSHLGPLNSLNSWTIKIDSNGIIQWEKSFFVSGYTDTRSIIQTTDNSYIITGKAGNNNSPNLSDGLIIKLDSLGNLQWQKLYGGSNHDDLSSVEETINGEYVLSGYTLSNDGDVSSNHGVSDAWIIDIDSIGNIIWEHAYGGSAGDQAYSIHKTNDNGFILSALSTSTDFDVNNNGFCCGNAWIVKLSPATVGIKEAQIESNFSLYPNPTTDIIHINTTNNLTNQTYILIDELGQTVLNGKLEDKNTVIKLQKLKAGFYTLQIGDEQKQSYKLIKK